ncbi:MAG TPA: hypothetical protein VNZ52_08150 [Candidatus Thermoplasmatota archaeon]|nr:hypothetical protein [Candidatus Thermoplasmatota archaeon]
MGWTVKGYTEVSLRLTPTLPEKLMLQIAEFHARVALESELGAAAAWIARAT